MDFSTPLFNKCRKWIKEQIDLLPIGAEIDWNRIAKLGVADEEFDSTLELYTVTQGFPDDIDRDTWEMFVEYYKTEIHSIDIIDIPVVAIDNHVVQNRYPVKEGPSCAWTTFENYISSDMSPISVKNIKKTSHWILNHLSEDTRVSGPVKGLVTGSVQSGKTANMEALTCMAADYNWNFFIILSGTIDSLRVQTRDRFRKDFEKGAEGVAWKVLDFSKEDKDLSESTLLLNPLVGSKRYSLRYVTVCLKNAKRLSALIDWLYSDPLITKNLRILIIDDEADQASICTAEITDDEWQERNEINRLIMCLANGKKSDGSVPSEKIQALNYIAYTATPYANVLNERGDDSLYPKDFVCTLADSYEYFGTKVVFGNDEVEDCPGYPIIRPVKKEEVAEIEKLHKNITGVLPTEMKRSISWYLASSALLRYRKYKKNISMLIHTTATNKYHFAVYEAIKEYLGNKANHAEILELCRDVYNCEREAVTIQDLLVANPKYSLIDKIDSTYPDFEIILPEIIELLNDIKNIELASEDDDYTYIYSNGINLCVDNCKAARESLEGTHLRIVYPEKEQLKTIEKAPVFIVIGGNTLSRGLTIEGLICTYFTRKSNQADTLMQMARWFGYRAGTELLQRIWMTDEVAKKFEGLAKIDMDLKKEIQRFMDHELSPATLGPKIRNIPSVKNFRITAKKKSQSAVDEEYDFNGDQYEVTDYEDSEVLDKNLNLTHTFLSGLCEEYSVRESDTSNAYVWDDVDYQKIRQYILDVGIYEDDAFATSRPIFVKWMDDVVAEGKYTKWNVAAFDGKTKTDLFEINSEIKLGKSEHSKKSRCVDHIDIGSLRSGIDVLADVKLSGLNSEQLEIWKKVKSERKDINAQRNNLNLGDRPILMIYIINGSGGKETDTRKPIGAHCDLVGLSIIVPGDNIGGNHVKYIRIG